MDIDYSLKRVSSCTLTTTTVGGAGVVAAAKKKSGKSMSTPPHRSGGSRAGKTTTTSWQAVMNGMISREDDDEDHSSVVEEPVVLDSDDNLLASSSSSTASPAAPTTPSESSSDDTEMRQIGIASPSAPAYTTTASLSVHQPQPQHQHATAPQSSSSQHYQQHIRRRGRTTTTADTAAQLKEGEEAAASQLPVNNRPHLPLTSSSSNLGAFGRRKKPPNPNHRHHISQYDDPVGGSNISSSAAAAVAAAGEGTTDDSSNPKSTAAALELPHRPQHLQITEDDDDDFFSKAPPNTYHVDMEFQESLLSQRNRRVLLSRLGEAAPRGKLTLINLCRRGLGVDDAHLIKEAILSNPQLYVLKLSYNSLGDDGAAVIASAILHSNNNVHHQLSVLDLGFNNIGDVGCGSLAVHCVAGNPFLQTLYLTGNQFGTQGALSLAGAILHGSNLKSLHLAVNQVGAMGMKAIAGAIAKNEARLTNAALVAGIDNNATVRRMEELHLGSSSITSDGFLSIPGMLLTIPALKVLAVPDNNLNDQDIMLLSQALTQNRTLPLQSLQLSFNQISCQGVECLMNAVWGSPTLREIKLDNNKIKDRGAQLCSVVLTAINLEALDLGFNKVTTTGIRALMKNVSENNSLKSLGLSGIPIDQNASKAVSYALAYNASLEALYLDNCSTGYASQRHIVAGAVSNRKSSLRVITGFTISPIAMSLGMPFLPDEWSNVQVLGFFRLMWQQWLLKSRLGSQGSSSDDETRGPAKPAAVAAASKIAFSSLGGKPTELFQAELHEKPVAERAPVEPAGAALLERTDSGTMAVPMFTVSSEVNINDFVDGEIKMAALTNSAPAPKLSTVRSPMENPERRNRNLQWLRLHFRSLSDVGRLPFHNADLWQLHQYYFSPPFFQSDEVPEANETVSGVASMKTEGSIQSAPAPPPTPAIPRLQGAFSNQAVSFQALGEALAASGVEFASHGNKRPSTTRVGEGDDGPAAKKSKSLKPRIAYYPRIMSKLQSLGNKPTEQTLSLLRQLKYAESVIFAGRNPYVIFSAQESEEPTHADVDMILLDLL